MNRNFFVPMLIVASMLVFSSTAVAQVKPFKVNGSGDTFGQGLSIVGDPSPHNATGNGISLGKYTGDEGLFEAISFDPETGSGTFKGRFVFVKKNGDRLVCSYGDEDNGAAGPGEFFAVPDKNGLSRIVFCAEFNPIVDECTGRYSRLIGGSFIMLAMTEPFELTIDDEFRTPPFDYSWEGNGFLIYAKR